MVYKIPCRNCRYVYVGDTKWTLKKQIPKHKQIIRKYDHNNGITVHVYEHDHHMEWDQAKLHSNNFSVSLQQQNVMLNPIPLQQQNFMLNSIPFQRNFIVTISWSVPTCARAPGVSHVFLLTYDVVGALTASSYTLPMI